MKYFSFLILCFLLPFHVFAMIQNPYWQRKITNYERAQYKGGAQNWMIAQSEKKWMYFANSNGLLEFDGVNWTLYPVRNMVVRSVKLIDNNIYIGGSTEFGYFEANEIGKLVYHTLSEKTEGWGGEVWNILDNKTHIYFISEYHIHALNKASRSIITVRSPAKIDCSTLFNNKVYFGTPEGIFYLSDDNRCILLPQSNSLVNYKITNLHPYKDKLLLTTSRRGMFFMDTLGNMNTIRSVADQFIDDNQLFSTALSGSKIALGSVQNGVFVFDLEDPSYSETFNLKNGLKNNTILDCYFDNDDNLWLGLDKGIAYIDLKSPIRPLFETTSSIGTGYCSIIYKNELYLGTNQGLYKVGKDASFQLIEKTEGQIWSLNIIDDKLFSSGDNGIVVISPFETYRIDIYGSWETHSLSADTNKLIVGTYSGFAILEKTNSRWFFSHIDPSFTSSCRGFVEDEDGYSFWVTNTNSNIQKISFDRSFEKVSNIKDYPLGNNSIAANTVFRIIDNSLVICTSKGIYQYSRITDSFNRYEQLESKLEGHQYYDFLFLDKYKNIWYITDQQLKYTPFVYGQYRNTYNLGLANDLIGSYENVYLADSSTAIVAVDNGFLKIDLSQLNKIEYDVNPFLKKITFTKNDSIIFYGTSMQGIDLPYHSNSLKIEFGATEYNDFFDILYTSRLVGIDKEWSTPSSQTIKEYTNLSAGNYTFELKAFVNGNEVPSEKISLSFRINPPWYGSTIAYIVYALFILIVFYFLYQKTISKQKKIINQKGEELIVQSQKHKEETSIKDKEIYELQNKNLRDRLQHKTQELNVHLLNVIRKNEILDGVKKNALKISKAIDEGQQANLIRQKVMSLVRDVDNSLKNDDNLEAFQSNFDTIHHDFFKILEEKYPQLNRNDKILCAYLKMNLSTKEIAPLINISVRGVEISRYRLRKKMNLDRNENLSEYMNSLKWDEVK